VKDVETMLGNGTDKEPSKSTSARELILDVLETEGEQESDGFDARVANETGLTAKTVRNLRGKLKNEGLIAPVPMKDEYGGISHWIVRRTQATRGDTE
jgi:hypothetical protein